MSRSAKPSGVRGWILLDTYLQIHNRRIQDFQDEGFLLEDSLEFRQPAGADRTVIKGRIRCQDSLFIDVETTLAVRIARGQKRFGPYDTSTTRASRDCKLAASSGTPTPIRTSEKSILTLTTNIGSTTGYGES
jgi:hypothetical protein